MPFAIDHMHCVSIHSLSHLAQWQQDVFRVPLRLGHRVEQRMTSRGKPRKGKGKEEQAIAANPPDKLIWGLSDTIPD